MIPEDPSVPAPTPAIPAPARRELWLMLLVVAGIFAAYSPVRHAGFIWDDDAHLTRNPCIVGPLGLKEIWTTSAADYFPLVLTNFWVQFQIWGLNPLPYHVLSVVLHAANALLLWLVLRRLRVPGAWLGAALWALHPVQVESVAWIAELKNTQSGLFFLAAIWFFLRWLERSEESVAAGRTGARDYSGALICAVAAVLSKPSTVMLPVVLGLCAWWVRRRWPRRELVPLAPFFLISAVASAWTVWEQRVHSKASGADWNEDFAQRVIIAGRTVWFYLGKLAWPEPLVFVYRRWTIDPTEPLAYLAPVLVLAGLWWFWRHRNDQRRALTFAGAYFVVSLFPVLGFFTIYYSRFSYVADHFQYLASMGPLALAGGAFARITSERRPFGAVLAVGALGLLTCRQTEIYHDNQTLWRGILARNDSCWLAHTNLAAMLLAEGKTEEAAPHAETAFRLKPDDFSVRHNLGNAQLVQGRVDDAIVNFRAAQQLYPNNPDIENSLGYALMLANQPAESENEFAAALRLRPDFAAAHRNFGKLLSQQNRLPEAIEQWRTAAAIQPDDYQTWFDLGRALAVAGETDEAIAACFAAVKLRPDAPGARCNLAIVLGKKGQIDVALQEVAAALKIDPNYAPARELKTRLEAMR